MPGGVLAGGPECPEAYWPEAPPANKERGVPLGTAVRYERPGLARTIR
jgi:hypothetical protein